jgi:hypothetical protein
VRGCACVCVCVRFYFMTGSLAMRHEDKSARQGMYQRVSEAEFWLAYICINFDVSDLSPTA